MSNIRTNMKLSTVDDLFTTQRERDEDNQEKILEIPLSDLHPYILWRINIYTTETSRTRSEVCINHINAVAVYVTACVKVKRLIIQLGCEVNTFSDNLLSSSVAPKILCILRKPDNFK